MSNLCQCHETSQIKNKFQDDLRFPPTSQIQRKGFGSSFYQYVTPEIIVNVIINLINSILDRK